MVLAAKENLIQARTPHLDSLGERLKDTDVKKVIEAIMAGKINPTLAQWREFEQCVHLGLVALDRGEPIIANPLYREVLPRVLNYGMQMDLFVEYAIQGTIIEIKLVHPAESRKGTLEEALAQVARYRATVGGPETATHIALFNRTEAGRKSSWHERLTWDVVDHQSSNWRVAVSG
jgi:hypothetical protein